MDRMRRTCFAAALALFLMISTQSGRARDATEGPDCAAIRTRTFADTRISSSEHIAGGALSLPADWPWFKPLLRQAPSFCRVIGVIRPTADSQIGFELWLPDQWNGRYLQSGNSGFAGSIEYDGLIPGLQNGFAVASTDDGHVGDDTGWMGGHPEKVIDYGYRAVHLTSVVAKQIINVFYDRPIPYSYFSGCSDGGREGLMEVQRYPDDFAGWIVGAPFNDVMSVATSFLGRIQLTAAMKQPLSAAQIEAITSATIARCDNLDGIRDGVIENPLRCQFDPKVLQCKAGADSTCLSPGQVKVVRAIYDDVKSVAGVSLLPGLQGTRGVEANNWELPKATSGFYEQLVHGFFAKLVFDDPKLDYTKIDLVDALNKGNAQVSSILSAMNPNLSAIRASGKKIIQYHGWADQSVPVQYSIRYYEAVEKYLQRDSRDFYRLFLAPGMKHCWAGPGPNAFGGAYTPGDYDPNHHALAALVEWVEKGTAPDRLIATKHQDDDLAKPIIRTRPLCPYPSVAHWTGTGSTDEASNFDCSADVVVSGSASDHEAAHH
jgi:Tannase and feruloyl esterase